MNLCKFKFRNSNNYYLTCAKSKTWFWFWNNINSYWTCANSNSEIVIIVNKLVPSQKLVFDFETIITLNELVQIQTPK
jgi:hypothetical protein